MILSYIDILGKFWQEKLNSQIFRWNLFFIVINLAYLILRFKELPSEVPLFYSLPWGEQQLAPPSYLFIFPIFSITTSLFNSILAAFFLHSIQLLSRLLLAFSLAVSFFSLFATYNIINLII